LLKQDYVLVLTENVSLYEDKPFGGFPALAYRLILEKARNKGIILLLDGKRMEGACAGYYYYHNDTNFTI